MDYGKICIDVATKVARHHYNKGTHIHFNCSDLESYLIEEAYKIYLSYDNSLHKYFEAYLWNCLQKKVMTFFATLKRDTLNLVPIESYPEGEGGTNPVWTNSIYYNFKGFIDPTDPYEELIIKNYIETTFEPKEQELIEYLLRGYNTAEVSELQGTYRLKTRRLLNKIKEKL